MEKRCYCLSLIIDLAATAAIGSSNRYPPSRSFR